MNIVNKNSTLAISIILPCILINLYSCRTTRQAAASKISITLLTIQNNSFVTFTNSEHPDNRIGYRLFEHTPIAFGPVPQNDQEAGINPAQVEQLEKSFRKRRQVVTKKIPINNEPWIRQDWTFYMAPVQNGIDILLIVQTYDQGLPEYYGVQQCFRMSGKTNKSAWRRKVAQTPAFSEYDLWAQQKDQPQKTSLTYVLRHDQLQPIPATRETMGVRTPIGLLIDNKRTNGKLMDKVGPYQAQMLEPVDCGLITRTNLEQTWVSGIFWQRTSHLTDHHPADCLHAIINIGPIPPHSRRALRGKIYWFPGTKEDLQKACLADFPH